jgi:cytochrome P450
MCIEPFELGGYTVKPGDNIILSPFIVHRDARWWPDPLRFDPDRFTPEAKASRPKLAYFPFGAGNRICIGEGFAWMEGVLILATLAQRWRMELVDKREVVPGNKLTLHSERHILMRLRQRQI